MTDILKIKTEDGWKGVAVVQGDESQKQSDWEQSDNTKADYIKNKPTKLSDFTDNTSTNPIDKADTLTGLSASVSELNYCDGVTSNIQTQLNGKQGTLTAGAGISISSNTIITKDIISEMEAISESEVSLVLGKSIYSKTISANTTFTFDLTNLGTLTNKVVTFEIYLNMPTIYTLTFPQNLTWIAQPNFNQTGKFLIAVRTLDGGSTYIANVEARWV